MVREYQIIRNLRSLRITEWMKKIKNRGESRRTVKEVKKHLVKIRKTGNGLTHRLPCVNVQKSSMGFDHSVRNV